MERPFRMKQRAGRQKGAQLEPDYARAAYKETNGHARRLYAESQIARSVATEGPSRNIISCDRNRP